MRVCESVTVTCSNIQNLAKIHLIFYFKSCFNINVINGE